MNLFINAVSTNWYLALFDEKRDIIFDKNMQVLWNESEILINLLDDFLLLNHIWYSDLKNIVVVSGPGSFTWIRTICLLANTIAFANKDIFLTDISFFDLFELYPICKPSSKRDSFVLFTREWEVEILQNEDLSSILLEQNIKIVYGELNMDFFNDLEVIDNINYKNIIKKTVFKNKKQIEALYIKKPNIS